MSNSWPSYRLKSWMRAQAELVELLGAPLEDVLNEHQLRCVALAEKSAPCLHHSAWLLARV